MSTLIKYYKVSVIVLFLYAITGCSALGAISSFLSPSSPSLEVSSQIGKNNESNSVKLSKEQNNEIEENTGQAGGESNIQSKTVGEISNSNLPIEHFIAVILGLLISSIGIGYIFGKLIPTKRENDIINQLIKIHFK